MTDFLEGSPIIIDWFFVASGFLITSLLLDERRATENTDLRRFYQRRALRLFPAMYLMIAVSTIILIIAVNFVPAAQEQLGIWWIEPLAAATYCYYIVAAFMPGTLDGVLGHTWSLTVEEQFYFVWPLVFLPRSDAGAAASDLKLIVGACVFIAVVDGDPRESSSPTSSSSPPTARSSPTRTTRPGRGSSTASPRPGPT